MPELSEDKYRRVMAVANRLRLVQADFADAPPEQRRRYLSDELDRALGGVVPQDRAAFLQALQDRFPSWDGSAPIAAPAPATTQEAPAAKPTAKTIDPDDDQDASYHLNRLCELAPALSEQAKATILANLRGAGVVPTAPDAPWPDELVQELREKLAVNEQKRVDPARVLELASMLSEYASNLHKLVGEAWRTIAPNIDVRHRRGALQNSMGRFASADAAVNRTQLSSEIERVRKLVASLIAGVGVGGREFAHNYYVRFSPEEIKTTAIGEKGGLFGGGIEAKCWRKYVELWDMLDESAIEKEIRDAIAKAANVLLNG